MKTTKELKKIIDELINKITEKTKFDKYRIKVFLEPWELHEEKYKGCGSVEVPFKNMVFDFNKRESYYYEGKITQIVR